MTWSSSSSEEGELKGKTDPLLEDTGRDQTKTHGSKSERRSEDSVPPKGREPHKNDLGKKPESDSEHEIDHDVLEKREEEEAALDEVEQAKKRLDALLKEAEEKKRERKEAEDTALRLKAATKSMKNTVGLFEPQCFNYFYLDDWSKCSDRDAVDLKDRIFDHVPVKDIALRQKELKFFSNKADSCSVVCRTEWPKKGSKQPLKISTKNVQDREQSKFNVCISPK